MKNKQSLLQNNKKFDPFENLVLDEYEQEIENALERGEFVSIPGFEKRKPRLVEAAKRYLQRQASKSITLRIKEKDLARLKAKAARNNVPYQTLIGLLIKSYNDGKTKLTL